MASTTLGHLPQQRILRLLKEFYSGEERGEDERRRLQETLAAVAAPLHEADVADLLEMIPDDQRLTVWEALPDDEQGAVLLEVSEQSRESLLGKIPDDTMAALMRRMAADDVAELLRDLTPAGGERLLRLAGLSDDPDLHASLSFADGTVGALMDFEQILARTGDTVAQMLSSLRTLGELPSHCDKLFIIDSRGKLAGVLPLKRLLLNAPDIRARDIMVSEQVHSFSPETAADSAAGAFERYDLISAPVVDGAHCIIGRITIDEILDHVHANRERALLSSAGVSEEEDLFASLPRRFKNRWRWLGINLIAAFVISRVVGIFEPTIMQLTALAALMPVVAGMSGNIGNQTATLSVRALALGQINPLNWTAILRGEAMLSIVNGLVWGGAVAVFAYFLYSSVGLSLVLLFSMTLCFLAAASAGLGVPMLMKKLGKDPALGATVVLSCMTDTLGFFIFLGLGALFLV